MNPTAFQQNPLFPISSSSNLSNMNNSTLPQSALFSPSQPLPLTATSSNFNGILPSPAMGFSPPVYSPNMYLSDLKSLSRYRVLESNYPLPSATPVPQSIGPQRPEDNFTPSFISRSIHMLNGSTPEATTTNAPLLPNNNSVVSMRALSTLSSLSALSNAHTSTSSLPSGSPPPDSLTPSMHSLTSLTSSPPPVSSSNLNGLPYVSQTQSTITNFSQMGIHQNQPTLPTLNSQQITQQQIAQLQMQLNSQNQQNQQNYGGLPPRPTNYPLSHFNKPNNLNMDQNNQLLAQQLQLSQYQMQLQQALSILNSQSQANMNMQQQYQKQQLLQQLQQLQQHQDNMAFLSSFQQPSFGPNFSGYNNINPGMQMSQTGMGMPYATGHAISSLGVTGLPMGLPDGMGDEYLKKKRENGSSCHQCKTRRVTAELIYCAHAHLKKGRPRKRKIEDAHGISTPKEERFCRKKYCARCLIKFYNEQPPALIGPNGDKTWSCPGCRGLCTCAACKRQVSKQESKKLKGHNGTPARQAGTNDSTPVFSSSMPKPLGFKTEEEVDESPDADGDSDESDDEGDSRSANNSIKEEPSATSMSAPSKNHTTASLATISALPTTYMDNTRYQHIMEAKSDPNTITPATPSMSTLLNACLNPKPISQAMAIPGMLNQNSPSMDLTSLSSYTSGLLASTPLLPNSTIMSPAANFGLLSSYMNFNNSNLSSLSGTNYGLSPSLPFSTLSSSPQLLQSSLFSPLTNYQSLTQHPHSFSSPPSSPFIPPNHHLLGGGGGDGLPSQSPLNMYRFMGNGAAQVNPLTNFGSVSTEGTS